MNFTYPPHIDVTLSSLPTTFEECTRMVVEYSIIYQKLYITNPESALTLLDSAAHIKYRQILLSEDHSIQSETFVFLYEKQLPLMKWHSEARDIYMFETDWELASAIKRDEVPTVFEDDTDIFQLQMLRLPCEDDFGHYYLERLFKHRKDSVKRRRIRLKGRGVNQRCSGSKCPTDVKTVGDVRYKRGHTYKRTGISKVIVDLTNGIEIPSYGPQRYRIVNAENSRYPIPSQFANLSKFAILPRLSESTSTYLNGCGFTLYSGANFTAFTLVETRRQWKRRKKRNEEVRSLQECAYQTYMHSWLTGSG